MLMPMCVQETAADLNITLSRRELLAELQARGIGALVPEEARQLLSLLEVCLAATWHQQWH